MMTRLSIVSLQNECLEAKPHEVHSLSANTSATAPVRIHFQIQSFPRQVCAALIGNPNGRHNNYRLIIVIDWGTEECGTMTLA